jgi:hypothetical protein
MARVAIIGAGWYGCHIASMLIADGHEVIVFERNQKIFNEASGNNQFRLHLGLHYARSARTRHQTRDGYHRFIERYPRFTQEVHRNLYAVPRCESIMDFDTYFSIMLSSGIRIWPESVKDSYGLRADLLEGLVNCNERVLLSSVAISHFTNKLSAHLRLGACVCKIERKGKSLIVCGERFDHVVDASWGGLRDFRSGYFFEGTVLFYFRLRNRHADFPALTLVDGPLWSIYPTEDPKLFTLSHVVHTPLGRSSSKLEIQNQLKTITQTDLEIKRNAMVQHVTRFLPYFSEVFEYVGPQLSIKMKPLDAADERSSVVTTEGQLTNVISGKVDTIFYASDHLLGVLQDR